MRIIDYGFMVRANDGKTFSLAQGYPDGLATPVSITHNGKAFVVIDESNASLRICTLVQFDKYTKRDISYIDKNKLYLTNGRTVSVLRHILSVLPTYTDDQTALRDSLRSFLDKYLEIKELEKREESEVC